MILVPKRKMVSGLEEGTLTEIQAVMSHLEQTVIDTIIYLPFIAHSAWFKYRLRIPVGIDMYG